MSGVSVSADTAEQAIDLLGGGRDRAPIEIRWRRGDYMTMRPRGRENLTTGCIVDARGCEGEEVPRSFERSADAVRYVARLLSARDAAVKEEMAKIAEAKSKEEPGRGGRVVIHINGAQFSTAELRRIIRNAEKEARGPKRNKR